jgi:hypothetical protein
MDKKKFETVLNTHTKKWWIDVLKTTDSHLCGRIKNGKQMSEYTPNPDGYPVVLEFKPVSEFCTMCCKQVDNRLETVDLRKKTVKCECGLKYTISLDSLMSKSK